MGNKWIKIIKNILLDIIIIILSILTIIIISGAVQINIQNKEYANILGYSLFKVETGSMLPTLQIGDIIIVKITKDVNVDDIITYKTDKSFITHRIKKIDDNLVITKGDNNNSEDKPIEKKYIIGKVAFMFNNVKVWKKVFSDTKVIIPIVVSVVLIFILTAYKEKIGEDNV